MGRQLLLLLLLTGAIVRRCDIHLGSVLVQHEHLMRIGRTAASVPFSAIVVAYRVLTRPKPIATIGLFTIGAAHEGHLILSVGLVVVVIVVVVLMLMMMVMVVYTKAEALVIIAASRLAIRPPTDRLAAQE